MAVSSVNNTSTTQQAEELKKKQEVEKKEKEAKPLLAVDINKKTDEVAKTGQADASSAEKMNQDIYQVAKSNNDTGYGIKFTTLGTKLQEKGYEVAYDNPQFPQTITIKAKDGTSITIKDGNGNAVLEDKELEMQVQLKNFGKNLESLGGVNNTAAANTIKDAVKKADATPEEIETKVNTEVNTAIKKQAQRTNAALKLTEALKQKNISDFIYNFALSENGKDENKLSSALHRKNLAFEDFKVAEREYEEAKGL